MATLKDKKILVTGGNGFLGHHVVDALREEGCSDIFIARSREFDLTKEDHVERLFKTCRPDVVFHLAGLVGGILVNKERPAEFFYQNLLMGTFMLHHSWKNGVQKFVAAGAGCGYPEKAPIPLKEESFWDGFPQIESAPYSLAKRLLSIQSWAYEKQYGFSSLICIPGNIYGPWDNYNLNDAHVVPALVRKFVEAQEKNASSVEIWGSGKPTRDFVYVRDVADGMLLACKTLDHSEIVNISSGKDTSIREIVEALIQITGYKGDIQWNTSRPDGQLRRRFDVTKAKERLGFKCRIDLLTGLKRTVEWYRENQNSPDLRK